MLSNNNTITCPLPDTSRPHRPIVRRNPYPMVDASCSCTDSAAIRLNEKPTKGDRIHACRERWVCGGSSGLDSRRSVLLILSANRIYTVDRIACDWIRHCPPADHRPKFRTHIAASYNRRSRNVRRALSIHDTTDNQRQCRRVPTAVKVADSQSIQSERAWVQFPRQASMAGLGRLVGAWWCDFERRHMHGFVGLLKSPAR